MRILMLGNSYTFTNDLPDMIRRILPDTEVMQHTRGGARLAEQLNPDTQMGAATQAALTSEHWDYVILQEMSNGPITARDSFLKSVKALCEQIRANGATPVLYATWGYQPGNSRLTDLNMTYEEMTQALHDAYHEAAEANDAIVADVGDAFLENADELDLWAADGSHPSKQGTLLAAVTITDTILKDMLREGRRWEES